MQIRLNKYLSQCGLGSRRKVEDYISSGRISINKTVITRLSTQVNTEIDVVQLDGKNISQLERLYYIVLNKPKNYITTTMDEKNRPTVMQMIPDKYIRAGVFPVGRLDKDTEGLLLLTNDGEMAHRLTHPEFEVQKEYIVELDKPLDDAHLKKIKKGIFLHQLKLKTRKCSIQKTDLIGKRVKITISEGKKRQIRYTFKNFGYKVTYLKRTGYGPLTVKGINKGDIRLLKEKEILKLKDLVLMNS